ncbi:MAG: hypothetical protein LAT84_12915 [Balneolia bacterium]|nr:hypothetical protein [Balneolia bacterium]
MADGDALLITFFKKGSFFGSTDGTLRLRGDDLILTQLNRKGEETAKHRLSLSRVKNAEMKSGLLSKQLIFKSLSRDYLQPIPGSDGVTLRIGIKKAQSSKAESFFKALKLRHSEIVLRGLTDDPTS